MNSSSSPNSNASPALPVPVSFQDALVNPDRYRRDYAKSVKDPEGYWGEEAKRLDWFAPWKKVKDCSFESPVRIRWFEGGKLNVSHNCLDRHLPKRGDQTAIIWEPDEPTDPVVRLSYRELHARVCRMANALKGQGVKRGDFVTVYLPMIPDAAVAMLACARIGAPHNLVFGGFSPDSLSDRISDSKSRFVITADEGRRAGKRIPLKANVDAALKKTPVEKVFVVKNTGGKVDFQEGRDLWLADLEKSAAADCPPETMDAEDPLFILYTSGSTNKPKGVLHTTGGYLVYAALTHELAFDYREGEVYMCTADV
ncbi:MAG: acetyl-coenzyme A synthetase, partial [Proteobacteria bacterium]